MADVALVPEVEYVSTIEEYEELTGDRRVEVIDGVVYDMAAPSQQHQRISGRLYYEIETYLREKNGQCEVYYAPFDVWLPGNPLTIVEPDLMVICDPSKLDGKRCNGAPDWIIEIISPSNSQRDYMEKLMLYLKSGVKEYWIVDALQGQVIVYELQKHQFLGNVYSISDKVKCRMYGGDLEIDFAEIMRE